MRSALLLAALLAITGIAAADFVLESAHVTISGISQDGSAHVREDIKFLVRGNFSNALYDSGFKTSDDLSVWADNTGLKDIKQHVNPAVVAISEFGLQPQPRTGCNPFLNTCHGEIIIDYNVLPLYDGSGMINGTGLFFVDNYKPRTTKYSINPAALSFSSTDGGNILLDPDVQLVVQLPQGGRLVDASPSATADVDAPQGRTLTWTDMVMVKYSLVFEVEESIDKEVGNFFSGALKNFQATVNSQHGMAFLVILAILVGSYIYINIAKKRKEE